MWLRGLLGFFAFGCCCLFRNLDHPLRKFSFTIPLRIAANCVSGNGQNSHFQTVLLAKFAAYYLSFSQTVYETARNGTTPKPPQKKNTVDCSSFAFRTHCSTLSWLRCAFFRLRLNFTFKLFRKKEICSLLIRTLGFSFRCASCPFLLENKNHHSMATGKVAISCHFLVLCTYLGTGKKNVAHCAVGPSNKIAPFQVVADLSFNVAV